MGLERTGKLIDSLHSFANTTEMTTDLLSKATEIPSVLTLALLVKTKIVESEKLLPFAMLLKEDRLVSVSKKVQW